MSGFNLLKEETLCEKHPEEVEPAKERTEEGNYNADYKSVKLLLLRPSGPSYNYLYYPVYEGNEEEEKLDESVLLVKPSHFDFSLCILQEASKYIKRYLTIIISYGDAFVNITISFFKLKSNQALLRLDKDRKLLYNIFKSYKLYGFL